MKRLFTTLFLWVLVCLSAWAQAPEKFSYQAVVRNATNNLVINSPVGVRVSILQGGVNGTLVYMETQTAVTNANGLITLQIGGGTVQQGVFTDIDWANGLYFLKTETDPNGGNDYSITSTQQLLSVPYALYAKEVGNGFSGNYNDLTNTPQIPTVPTNVSAFTNDAGYITAAQCGNVDICVVLEQLQAQVAALQSSLDSILNNGGVHPQATLPTVTTNTVSNITSTSATCGGNVTTDGGASVTARGVCWSTSPNPTVSDSHTTDGSGMGSFSSSITVLTANTTYYVRAYATNSVGTTYGNEVSITTLSTAVIDERSCSATPTVTDHEGNVYATVQIGNQCWMRDNLRTTTSPSTGTYLIPATTADYSWTGKQARWYNNDSATYASMNYGLLYNWNAAVDTFNTVYGELSVNTNSDNEVFVTFTGHRRGICPAGWHLPSDAEWNTMEATVSGSDWQTSYETSEYYRGSHAGKLSGGDNWTTSTTSGAPGDYGNAARNVSGFSAVPASSCTNSSFVNAGNSAYFWSSTQYYSSPYNAYCRYLYYLDAGVGRGIYVKYYGYSVRCLRD